MPQERAGQPSVLAARHLVKQYGGVLALDGAGIALRPGEVHGLVGENGAGKSTLVKVLSGVTRPDAGTVEIGGHPVEFGGRGQAAAAGIAVVAQELSLFPDLPVVENLYPTAAPRRYGLVSHRRIGQLAAPVLARLGLDHVNLRTPVGLLDPADQQLIEIAKAMLQHPRVLILDEPTSSLPAAAVDRLEAVLRTLAADSLAILYISHFLEEVLRLAGRVSVMRDARLVLDGRPTAQVPLADLVAAMLGDDAPAQGPRSAVPTGADGGSPQTGDGSRPSGRTPDDHAGVMFTGVTVPGRLRGVDLRAGPGEIVGVAGLQGAGHLTALEVVCGRARPSAGAVRLPGDGPLPRNLRMAIRAGVAFVPSDRKRYGLMLEQTVAENVSAVSWLALRRGGAMLRPRVLNERADAHARRLRLRGHPDSRVGDLSGGNQQKVVFAKWLDADPAVVVLDDPTRGVDVGARAQMHDIVRDLAAADKVVLIASSDLSELVELCNRVLVFQRGRVVKELSTPTLTERTLSIAMNAGFTTPHP